MTTPQINEDQFTPFSIQAIDTFSNEVHDFYEKYEAEQWINEEKKNWLSRDNQETFNEAIHALIFDVLTSDEDQVTMTMYGSTYIATIL